MLLRDMRFTLSMKKLTCYRNARINAFSLPELLVVLVIIGILVLAPFHVEDLTEGFGAFLRGSQKAADG